MMPESRHLAPSHSPGVGDPGPSFVWPSNQPVYLTCSEAEPGNLTRTHRAMIGPNLFVHLKLGHGAEYFDVVHHTDCWCAEKVGKGGLQQRDDHMQEFGTVLRVCDDKACQEMPLEDREVSMPTRQC